MKMKISQIKINSRFRKDLGDIKSLAKSIQEIGLIHPPTVNERGELIAGYRRIKACEMLGWKEIPVTKLNLDDILRGENDENILRKEFTPSEKVAIALALEEREKEKAKERMIGKGIAKKKGEKITSEKFTEDKGEAKEKVAKVVGWSRPTYEKAKEVFEAAKKNPEKFGDLAERLDKEDVSVITAHNELKRRMELEERKKKIKNTEIKGLYLGDALEKIDEIPDDSIDVLLTDPPYGLGENAGYVRQQIEKLRRTDNKWKIKGDTLDVFRLLDELLEKLKPKLKENAHIYIFTTWKRWHLLYPVVAKHYEVKNCLVWNKKRGFLGETLGYNYMEAHELILFVTKGKRKLNYEKEKPLNILTFEPVPNPQRVHPTEKPVELLKALISWSTVENETVFDPFCGSGSTLVAAEELGRNWVGIEIDPHWYDVARSRIAELRKTKGGEANG